MTTLPRPLHEVARGSARWQAWTRAPATGTAGAAG
jgi:hypothetical protein